MNKLVLSLAFLLGTPAMAMQAMDPQCLDNVFNSAEAAAAATLDQDNSDYRSETQRLAGETLLDPQPAVASPAVSGSGVMLGFRLKTAFDQNGEPVTAPPLEDQSAWQNLHTYMVFVSFDFQCTITAQEFRRAK